MKLTQKSAIFKMNFSRYRSIYLFLHVGCNGITSLEKMEEASYLGWLANLIGCPEAGLRLLISLLLGYPIAFIYRKHLYGKPSNWQHLYFIACGIILCFFNYGWDVIHSFSSITITYLVLKFFGGSLFSLLVVFTYTMLHLLIGYWTTATSTYDIKWTMPQCVLTLRLIGLAFNYYDGQQPKNSLSEENKSVALESLPSVLEVFAHSYFPSSFLVGPQLPLKRYRDFVERKLEKKENFEELPDSVGPGLLRFCLGMLYLVIYQVGSFYVFDDYFISEEYKTINIVKKLFLLGLWSRITLYKYISCWLITEGSCIVMGLTYNGVNEKGEAKWDGCSNVKLSVFECSTKMNHYIDSFNINTNHWVAQYIYKRLKFLNNKTLSYVGALLFLAIWHGFHSGYYATFFFEYIVITAEKNVIDLLSKNAKISGILNTPALYPIFYVFLRIYTFVIMGYAMIPFILLKYHKYMPVFKQFYFFMHIITISIIALYPVMKKKISSNRLESDSSASTSQRNEIQNKRK